MGVSTSFLPGNGGEQQFEKIKARLLINCILLIRKEYESDLKVLTYYNTT